MNAKEDLSVKDLEKVTKEISSERSEELMTIAERLKEEGRQEGKEEGKEEVAKNLLKMNLDLKEIEKATGLSKEKILEIKKKVVN
jgi:predicted transposase/invertase (TIGR01784 family)